MVEQRHSFASRVSGLARHVHGLGRHDAAGAWPGLEPCAACGEETAVGSVFFFDRLRIPRHGRPDAFLCGMCKAEMRASGMQPGMTDKDVAAFERNASAMAITWWSHF
jgi:hypothetical protein